MPRHHPIKLVLLDCVKSCNTRAVEDILRDNPDLVLTRYRDNDTMLHIAARLGYIGVVKAILNTPYRNLEALNIWDETPLLAAASATDGVRNALIKAGANAAARDGNGLTLNQRIEQASAARIYHVAEPVGLNGKFNMPYPIINNDLR